jgi:hypothetical protein
MCCQETAEPLATCLQECFSTGGVLGVFQLLRQIEIVPADEPRICDCLRKRDSTRPRIAVLF